MEIQYQNTSADFKAFYEDSCSGQKRPQRDEYYYSVCWYLAVIGLGAYLAVKHEELFAACAFVILAAFYLRQNWSFEQHWNARAEQYAAVLPEASCTLRLDADGVIERFSGVGLRVDWPEIHGYTIREDRLFLHFLKQRAFVIPFRYLTPSQRDELLKTLEQHNVLKRA